MDEEGEGWRRVGAGLRLVMLALATLLIHVVASAVVGAALIGPVKDVGQIQDALNRDVLNRDHPATMTVLTGVRVLASVLAIAGKAFCLSVPAAAGATAFIVMALACDVTSLAMEVIVGSAPAGEARADLAQVGLLAWLFGYFAFVRFLRRLAGYFREPRLVGRGRRLMVGSSALFLTTFLAVFGKALGGSNALFVLAALLLMVGGPALFVLYARLVHDLRRAAEAAAEAAPGRD